MRITVMLVVAGGDPSLLQLLLACGLTTHPLLALAAVTHFTALAAELKKESELIS